MDGEKTIINHEHVVAMNIRLYARFLYSTTLAGGLTFRLAFLHQLDTVTIKE